MNPEKIIKLETEIFIKELIAKENAPGGANKKYIQDLMDAHNKKMEVIRECGNTPKWNKDRFKIFIDIVCIHFRKSSTDHLLSLGDLVKLIQKTNEVFDAFDNSISIEENVNNFYRNYKNNS